jgi:hypothetical protein
MELNHQAKRLSTDGPAMEKMLDDELSGDHD